MLCVKGKNWAKEVWEKQAPSRQQRYLFCGLLHANFSLSPVGLNIRQWAFLKHFLCSCFSEFDSNDNDLWPKVWKWLQRTTKLMRQFWSCQIESNRGKVSKARLCGSLRWLFCCLLQVTRAGLEFQPTSLRTNVFDPPIFCCFCFYGGLLMGNYFERDHWVPITPDTYHITQLTLKSSSKAI